MAEALRERRPTPRADKRLGQHYLLDPNLNAAIARLAGPLEGRRVLEVGPGPGGLTRALIEAGAARVLAIEKDARFLPGLDALAAAFPGRLTVVHADALKIDPAVVAAEAPQAIVANLPYNIATPLLVGWLTGPLRPASMTLMFQKEVALRLGAAPGSADYGRLGVLAQALASVRRVLDVAARAFVPPPRVDSALVRFEPIAPRPPDALVAALETVTRAAFGQRRKMLRSSLKLLGGEALLAAAGIDPAARAEQIPVAGFLALARALLPLDGEDGPKDRMG